MKSFSIYFLTPLLAVVLILFPFTLQAKESRLSDLTITKEVQQKIRDNLFYTVFDWVTVSTHEGNVTLHGYVHLPWDKAFFVKISKGVEGVRSVTDKIKKVYGPDELRYKAAEAIYGSPDFQKYAFMKDPPVHIVVTGNRVILEGAVTSQVEKSWADLLVQWRTNAFKVKNDLSIENS
ncbi:MAG: BON domain-containing protein [Ignavibacteriaceae bacterium]|jgi:osmotically-inducible protein OsmY